MYASRGASVLCVLFVEHGNSVIVFHYGSVDRIYGNTHHRSAVHYLARLLRAASDSLDNVSDPRADRNDNVCGRLDCGAVYRQALFNEWHTRS